MTEALILSIIAGSCTGLGAALVFIAKRITFAFMAFAMSFSAGIMIYISLVNLLPMAMEVGASDYGEMEAKFYAILAFTLGAGLTALIDFLVPEHFSQEDIDKSGKNDKESSLKKRSYRTGIFVAIALALHNFPEGMAVFSTVNLDFTLGVGVAIAIALHNIPEGLIVALPIYNATNNKKSAFIWATLSGLTEPLGAVFAFFLLNNIFDNTFLAMVNAFVAGIMVFISFDELLPMAKTYGYGHLGILGAFFGMIFIALVGVFV